MHGKRLIVSLLALGLAAGCTANGGKGPVGSGTGRLVVDLVDAPADEFQEVVVTIDKVTAHSSVAGWFTVTDVPVTVDLLTLKTTALTLGAKDLATAKITQLRLYTRPEGPQYVTLADGTKVDLKVPSGPKSGIKIVGNFDLPACAETTITLDFDPLKSIHVHPASGGDLWILRPVIKAKKIITSSVGCIDADAGTPSDVDSEVGEGGAGSACSLATECLSGVCGTEGLCAPGGAGAPCHEATDCASNACLPDGSCDNGAAVGTGSPCVLGTDCLSSVCAEGVCVEGIPGVPCVVDADCAVGLGCVAGLCAPAVN